MNDNLKMMPEYEATEKLQTALQMAQMFNNDFLEAFDILNRLFDSNGDDHETNRINRNYKEQFFRGLQLNPFVNKPFTLEVFGFINRIMYNYCINMGFNAEHIKNHIVDKVNDKLMYVHDNSATHAKFQVQIAESDAYKLNELPVFAHWYLLHCTSESYQEHKTQKEELVTSKT